MEMQGSPGLNPQAPMFSASPPKKKMRCNGRYPQKIGGMVQPKNDEVKWTVPLENCWHPLSPRWSLGCQPLLTSWRPESGTRFLFFSPFFSASRSFSEVCVGEEPVVFSELFAKGC